MARGLAADLVRRSAGLAPGTNIRRPGAAGIGIHHGHSPVVSEPTQAEPGERTGKPVALSAGLSPSTPGQKPKTKPPARSLRERIKALNKEIREEEMKEREVPGGVGVTSGPGTRTAS